MKVLLTVGGTEEPIDGVRRLVNRSTGMTGLTLARHLCAHGMDVCLLHSQRIDADGLTCDIETFLTFDQLASSLQNLLSRRHFDAVIHLAAVSDYHLHSVEVDGKAVASIGRGKLGTGHDLVLRLRPNPKLIDRLRGWSANPHLIIVGFKLTDEAEPKACSAQVQALLTRGAADFVVHNDNKEICADRHVATIYSTGGEITKTQTKEELAGAIFELLANRETL